MNISEVINPVGIDKVEKFLDTAPRDQLFTASELSEILSVPRSTIRESAKLFPFRVIYNGKPYWGSIVAIEEFMRQVGMKASEEQ